MALLPRGRCPYSQHLCRPSLLAPTATITATLVELFTQPTDLALGDAIHTKRFDQIVHRAGRNALDVGLLDYRLQRPLGHPTGFKGTRKVVAVAQLWDPQFYSAGPRLPVARAVSVALKRRWGDFSP